MVCDYYLIYTVFFNVFSYQKNHQPPIGKLTAQRLQ